MMSNDSNSCGCVGNVATFPAVANAPIACTLSGDAMRARADEFLAAFAHLVAKERFASGFRWTFRNAPGFDETLRELARREHACCNFVTFTLTTLGSRIVWETRGPATAENVIELYFRTPETLPGDPDAFRKQAEDAGLRFVATARVARDLPAKADT